MIWHDYWWLFLKLSWFNRQAKSLCFWVPQVKRANDGILKRFTCLKHDWLLFFYPWAMFLLNLLGRFGFRISWFSIEDVVLCWLKAMRRSLMLNETMSIYNFLQNTVSRYCQTMTLGTEVVTKRPLLQLLLLFERGLSRESIIPSATFCQALCTMAKKSSFKLREDLFKQPHVGDLGTVPPLLCWW